MSNALDAGYGWSDFEQAAATATTVVLSEANGTGLGSESNAEFARGNGLSPLTEVQQLLLMCQTLADLLDVKAMYPAAEVAVAYNSLNSCDRRQIRNLILREAGPISVDGQAMSPCQLLSSFPLD